MCSPTSVSFVLFTNFKLISYPFGQDGAACCIVASEDFVHNYGLENQAIEIVSTALTTDSPVALGKSAIELVGYTMSKNCADKVFAEAGFAPGQGRDQVGVVELHDCFAANEVFLLNHKLRLANIYVSASHLPSARPLCYGGCPQAGRSR